MVEVGTLKTVVNEGVVDSAKQLGKDVVKAGKKAGGKVVDTAKSAVKAVKEAPGKAKAKFDKFCYDVAEKSAKADALNDARKEKFSTFFKNTRKKYNDAYAKALQKRRGDMKNVDKEMHDNIYMAGAAMD